MIGTVGLGVSRPHEWTVLSSGPSFSYLHHIGDMRYATILWYFVIWPCSRHGIWPWRFGSHFHMLFALYSISLLQSNTVCLSRPPTPVYISSTPGLCKAWELVALGPDNMPVQASICICPGATAPQPLFTCPV